MSKKINRRDFLVRGLSSLAGLTVAGALADTALARQLAAAAEEPCIDLVPLGATGLTVSRVAMGTGTIGSGGASNQTRLGQEAFTRIFRHGYERGVRFADTAETYGSMPFMGRAIKGLPRETITVLSKMWTHDNDSPQRLEVGPKVEEYLRLLGTDHIDILLMHCMTDGDWNRTRTRYMEGFARAKAEGKVRAVGVSCHNLDALRTAAAEPWVDIIMARVNPFGSHMDGPVDTVAEVLHLARTNGKGVVGMKIFGEGRHVKDAEREQSIDYAIHRSGVHAMTLGLQSVAQMDDAIARVARLSARA
jgi:aryl-alcohol dehydrogenase-like predicted oxidoreductase